MTEFKDTTLSEASSSTKEIQERIQNIKSDTPEKKRKKKIWNIIFILFNILVLVLVFVLNPPDTEHGLSLKGINGWYLLAAVACFVVVIFSEALVFFFMIHKTTKRWRFRLAVKTAFVGRYYDNVTPLSTGGQPFQMHTMNKAGVPGAIATSIPLAKYFTYMVLYCLIGAYVMIFQRGVISSLDPVVRSVVLSAAWVGFVFSLIVPSFILLCSVIRPLGMSILRFALRIGKRLKLVKNHGAAYLKAQKMLIEYQRSIKHIANLRSLLLVTVINFITYAATAITPYFIILSFTGGDFVLADMFSTAFMTIIVLIASSFFPAPGASGAAELSFGAVFKVALVGSALPVAMLLWRGITFYSFIFIGIGIIIYDQIKKRYNSVREEHALSVDTPEVTVEAISTTMEEIQKGLKEIQNQTIPNTEPIFVDTEDGDGQAAQTEGQNDLDEPRDIDTPSDEQEQ